MGLNICTVSVNYITTTYIYEYIETPNFLHRQKASKFGGIYSKDKGQKD